MITAEKESRSIRWWEVVMFILVAAIFIGIIVYQIVPDFKVFIQKFADDVYCFTTIPR